MGMMTDDEQLEMACMVEQDRFLEWGGTMCEIVTTATIDGVLQPDMEMRETVDDANCCLTGATGQGNVNLLQACPDDTGFEWENDMCR